MSETISPPRAFADRLLSDIAATLPGATAVFRRRKLDFCCGGKVPLRDALAGRPAELAETEAELEALAQSAVSPAPAGAKTAELIALIEDRYHAGHRRDLPELIRLARRVEAVHKDNPSVPRGLAQHLASMERDLTSHMAKEELILFPMMRRGGGPMIGGPIAVMLAEHDTHGEELRGLERLTNDFTPPAEACTTWRALYAGARHFADELIEHIHLENNVLFPRFTSA